MKKRKYYIAKNGEEITAVRVTLLLSREQFETIERVAKERGTSAMDLIESYCFDDGVNNIELISGEK